MEYQTRFDLNIALENWRAELAAQAHLTPDDRRELETHLRDSLSGLQARGLCDEESFWLARRRVGQPQQLDEEFVKVDPAKIRRERTFWVMLLFLVIQLWSTLASSVVSAFYKNTVGNLNWFSKIKELLPEWMNFYLPNWIGNLRYEYLIPILIDLSYILFVVILLVLLVRGKLANTTIIEKFAFQSKQRFALFATFLAIFDSVIAYGIQIRIWNPENITKIQTTGFPITNLFYHLLGFVWIIVIATWLIPEQNHQTSKQARV